jgi:hypothetical protein
MKKLLFRALLGINCCMPISAFSISPDSTQFVFTSDVDHFWEAYDSIRTTGDSLRQLHYIQSIYIERGTPGLRAFMEARDYSADQWVHLIRSYPRFWNSIRGNTLQVKNKQSAIEESVQRLRTLYPDLKPARMYFTVGCLRSGGTTMNDMVLIGTEIATGDPHTDASEFPDDWLRNVFRNQDQSELVFLNVHEYIHTQQRFEGEDLLSHCIQEGSADFMAELATRTSLQTTYVKYGKEHEADLKARFKKEMFMPHTQDWLYNGAGATGAADLGYFIGYSICSSYYQHAADKKQAVKDIIELNYADSSAVTAFLIRSRYYPEGIDKDGLIRAYVANQPLVMKMTCMNGSDSAELANGDTLVNPGTSELYIYFSRPMQAGVSIQYGPRGKDFFPGGAGSHHSPDDKSLFIMKLELKPGHDYEFVLSGKRFRSVDGYFLKDVRVKFRTRRS